jgi:hypothetical protein
MCGTTTVDKGNDSDTQTLAWRITIERQRVDQHRLGFELLELDWTNWELQPVPGEARVFPFTRK